MATRATYEINDGEHRATFYCHWDGYPLGAGVRFCAAVAAYSVAAEPGHFDTWNRHGGGWPFAFIRGVTDAEPTEGRDAHGDTEFHYVLRTEENGVAFVEVWQPQWKNGERKPWKRIGVADIAAWLAALRKDYHAQHKPENEAERIAAELETDEQYPIIIRCHHDGRTCYATLPEAMKTAANLAADAAKFGPENPNTEHYRKHAKAWADAIKAALDADEKVRA